MVKTISNISPFLPFNNKKQTLVGNSPLKNLFCLLALLYSSHLVAQQTLEGPAIVNHGLKPGGGSHCYHCEFDTLGYYTIETKPVTTVNTIHHCGIVVITYDAEFTSLSYFDDKKPLEQIVIHIKCPTEVFGIIDKEKIYKMKIRKMQEKGKPEDYAFYELVELVK